MPGTSFRDFYNDDSNVSPAERARIESEVALMGKELEAREARDARGQRTKETGLPQAAATRLKECDTNESAEWACGEHLSLLLLLRQLPFAQKGKVLRLVKQKGIRTVHAHAQDFCNAAVANDTGIDTKRAHAAQSAA